MTQVSQMNHASVSMALSCSETTTESQEKVVSTEEKWNDEDGEDRACDTLHMQEEMCVCECVLCGRGGLYKYTLQDAVRFIRTLRDNCTPGHIPLTVYTVGKISI